MLCLRHMERHKIHQIPYFSTNIGPNCNKNWLSMKLCLPSINLEQRNIFSLATSSRRSHTIGTIFDRYNRFLRVQTVMFLVTNRLQRYRFTSPIPQRGRVKWIEVKKWDSLGVMANRVKFYVLDSGRTDSVSDIVVLMTNRGCTFLLWGYVEFCEQWDLGLDLYL